MKTFLTYLIQNPVKVIAMNMFGLVLLAIFNPNQNDFIMYEAQRFNKKMEITECEKYKYGGGVMYEENSGVYQEICKKLIAEYRQNPIQIINYITANTKKTNWIILSIYETEYKEMYNEIEKRVKSDPKYLTYQMLPGIRSTNSIVGEEPFPSANKVIGIFGNFIDWR